MVGNACFADAAVATETVNAVIYTHGLDAVIASDGVDAVMVADEWAMCAGGLNIPEVISTSNQ